MTKTLHICITDTLVLHNLKVKKRLAHKLYKICMFSISVIIFLKFRFCFFYNLEFYLDFYKTFRKMFQKRISKSSETFFVLNISHAYINNNENYLLLCKFSY